MVRRPEFSIVYDPEVQEHLEAIERRHHSMIRKTIQEQLRFEPDVETRNRKPLVRDVEIGGDWELRFGPDNRFRVFYTLDLAALEVQVLAIGVKKGNRLRIGDEEIDL